MKLIIMLIPILMITFTSCIYQGETYTQDLSSQFDSITQVQLIGNSTPMNVSFTGKLVSITIPTDYEPSNFSILVTGLHTDGVVTTEESVVYRYYGGRSSKPVYINNTITQEVEKIVYQNVSQNITLNNVPVQSSGSGWYILLIFITIILTATLTYFITRSAA